MNIASHPHTLEEELKEVRNTLSGQDGIPGDAVEWEFHLEEGIPLDILVPKTIVLGFIMYFLHFGRIRKSEKGKVEISVRKTGPGILIIVTDNRQLHYSNYDRGETEGSRLEKLNEVINAFNRDTDHSVHYQILDMAYSEPGKSGTRVLISINF